MKKNHKDILILNWGRDTAGLLWVRQKVKFPKQIPVTIDFNRANVVGIANNFKNTPKGITCDVLIDKDIKIISDTVAPALKVFYGENGEIFNPKVIGLAFANVHVDEACQGNMRRKKNA